MRLLRYVVGVAAVAAFAGTLEAQQKDRNTITREEIMASAQKDGDLFQAIRSLRPHFLAKPRGVRTMGASPPQEPAVFVNGSRLGELALLKTILAADVHEVRYLDPAKSQDEYGSDVTGGAVVVQLVKGIKNP